MIRGNDVDGSLAEHLGTWKPWGLSNGNLVDGSSGAGSFKLARVEMERWRTLSGWFSARACVTNRKNIPARRDASSSQASARFAEKTTSDTSRDGEQDCIINITAESCRFTEESESGQGSQDNWDNRRHHQEREWAGQSEKRFSNNSKKRALWWRLFEEMKQVDLERLRREYKELSERLKKMERILPESVFPKRKSSMELLTPGELRQTTEMQLSSGHGRLTVPVSSDKRGYFQF